jgi:membrane associated rhomboid family serine protease
LIKLLGTCALAGVAGGLFAAIVAQALGLSVPFAGGVAGTVMAVLVALILARERRRSS